jgi:hypothetical protein
VKRLPPVDENNLRCRAGAGGGKRAGTAIFHDLVSAPEMLAAQGQSAGLASRSGWFQDMKGTADGIQKER